jgi:hypothetical protein
VNVTRAIEARDKKMQPNSGQVDTQPNPRKFALGSRPNRRSGPQALVHGRQLAQECQATGLLPLRNRQSRYSLPFGQIVPSFQTPV